MNVPVVANLESEDATIEAIDTEILTLKPELDTAIQAFLASGNHDRTPINQELANFAPRLREAIRPIDDLSHEAGVVLKESFYQLFQDIPIQLAAQILRKLDHQIETEQRPEWNYIENWNSQRVVEVSTSHLILKEIREIQGQMQSIIDSGLLDAEKLARIAELKEAFLAALEKGPFYYGYDIDRKSKVIRAHVEQGETGSINIILADEHGRGSVSSCLEINKVFLLFESIKNIQQLSSVPSVDHDRLEVDRLKYGAKAANLLALQKLLGQLKESNIFGLGYMHIDVPPFLTVPAEIYDCWKTGNDIDSELHTVFAKAQQYDQIIVRSSAVHSEDGEETTGAGVYDSIRLYNEEWDEEERQIVITPITFERFKAAIIDVYESCDSDKAKAYRKDNDIPHESMGIVVQKLIPDGYTDQADTSRLHTPNLIEIRPSGEFPIVFDKNKVKKFLLQHSRLALSRMRDIAYLPVDLEKVSFRFSLSNIYRVLELSILLEQAYGRAVQLEFTLGKDGTFRSNMLLLQARPIPEKMLKPANIEFPEQEPIAIFNSLGVCDTILPVLSEPLGVDQIRSNADKVGIVFYNTSHLGSEYFDCIEMSLPKEGVVVMLGNSAADHGHIETRAIEKGLTILCPKNNEEGMIGESLHLTGQVRAAIKEAMTNDASPLKYRVVSNGIEARIYPTK